MGNVAAVVERYSLCLCLCAGIEGLGGASEGRRHWLLLLLLLGI